MGRKQQIAITLRPEAERLGRLVYRLVRKRQYDAAHEAVRQVELADRHGPEDGNWPLDQLGLPRSLIQTLAAVVIHTVADVRDRTDQDLVAIGLSPDQIAELRLLARPPQDD